MPLEDLEIYGGEEAKDHINDKELESLIDFGMYDYVTPEMPQSRIRSLVEAALNKTPNIKVKAAILKTRERLRDLFPSLSSTRKFGKDERENELNLRKYISQEDLENGNITIARVNGEIAGMAKVYKWDKIAPNEYFEGSAWEIGSAYIIDSFRGQGIYSKLRKQALANLRERHGDVPVLTHTKNEIIKKMCRAGGWQEISYEEYLRLICSDEEYMTSKLEGEKGQGWTAFIYMPQKAEA